MKMCMLFLFRCREWQLGKSGGGIRSEVEGLLSHTEKSSPTLLNRFKHQKKTLPCPTLIVIFWILSGMVIAMRKLRALIRALLYRWNWSSPLVIWAQTQGIPKSYEEIMPDLLHESEETPFQSWTRRKPLSRCPHIKSPSVDVYRRLLHKCSWQLEPSNSFSDFSSYSMEPQCGSQQISPLASYWVENGAQPYSARTWHESCIPRFDWKVQIDLDTVDNNMGCPMPRFSVW